MLKWHIEYAGQRAHLERVELMSIRSQVDPIRDHLANRLAGLDDEDGILDVVFVLDEDRKLSLALGESALLVNRARDILGEEDIIGNMLSHEKLIKRIASALTHCSAPSCTQGISSSRSVPMSHSDRRPAEVLIALFPSAHSHTVAMRQPLRRSSSRARASRSTVRANLSRQKSTFDAGVVAKRHPVWRCQKQPWTKTAA